MTTVPIGATSNCRPLGVHTSTKLWVFRSTYIKKAKIIIKRRQNICFEHKSFSNTIKQLWFTNLNWMTFSTDSSTNSTFSQRNHIRLTFPLLSSFLFVAVVHWSYASSRKNSLYLILVIKRKHGEEAMRKCGIKKGGEREIERVSGLVEILFNKSNSILLIWHSRRVLQGFSTASTECIPTQKLLRIHYTTCNWSDSVSITVGLLNNDKSNSRVGFRFTLHEIL